MLRMLSLLAGLLLVASPLSAADVAWQSDVDAAWQTSVRENRPLLVFLTSSGCRYCSMMKQKTYSDPTIAAKIEQSFVPVAVDASRVAWLVKQMEVSGYPTTLIISPEAEVLDHLKGYVAPERLLPRLDQAAPPGRIATRPTKKTS